MPDETPLPTFPAQRNHAPSPACTATDLRTGHVYLDARQRRLHCLNQSARDLHDEGMPFTSMPVAGTRLRHLAGGEDVGPAELPLLVAWREKRTVEASFLFIRLGKPICQLTWSAAPFLDAQGQVVGVIGSVQCAPPEPEIQAIAGLAHDLRTPLHAIGLFLSALEKRSLTEPQQRALVDGLRAAAERALRIGGDLLEWCGGPARPSRGEEPPWFPLKPFLVNLALEQVVTAERKGLSLTTDLSAAEGWEACMDRTRLGRLLSNLLVNAVRYTHTGSVVFQASWREEPAGRFFALSVVDTGIGITPEEQESIFQPFERGRAGKEGDSGGSGLGLAVVDRLVEELGLRLEVQSEFGRGSAFHLLLPAPLVRGKPAVELAPAGASSA